MFESCHTTNRGVLSCDGSVGDFLDNPPSSNHMRANIHLPGHFADFDLHITGCPLRDSYSFYLETVVTEFWHGAYRHMFLVSLFACFCQKFWEQNTWLKQFGQPWKISCAGCSVISVLETHSKPLTDLVQETF